MRGSLIYLLVSMLTCLWVGCTHPQVYEWVESQTLSFSPDLTTDAVTTTPAIMVAEGDTLLYFYHRQARALQFFDAHTGKLQHRVTLDALPDEELRYSSGFVLFHAASWDSIWISLVTSYRYGRHDSLVWLLDSSGKAQHVYDLVSPHLRGPWLEDQQHDSLLYMFYQDQLTLEVSGSRVLFPLTTYQGGLYGTEQFHARNWPAGGHLDPVRGEFVPHNSVQVLPPDTLGTGLWPDEYGYPIVLPTHDAHILYAFVNHDTVFRYDPSTGQAERLIMASPFSYELRPHLEGMLPSQLDRMPDPYVANVLYDPFQKNYIRVNSYGCDPPGQKRWLVTYYDQQLQFLGAGLLPPDIDARSCFATPYGLGVVHDRRYAKEGIVQIQYLRPVAVATWEQSPLTWKSCAPPRQANFDPQVVLGYLRSTWPSDTSQVDTSPACYLLVPTDNTCPACMEVVKQYLEALVAADKTHYLRVILAGEGPAAIRDAMQVHSPFDIPETVRLDSTNTYLDELGSFFNPRFIVVQRDTLLQDEVLGPEVINQLPKLVRSYQIGQ